MHHRDQHYRDRCQAEGRPSLIAFDGVKSINGFNYGDDGMLRQGRKLIGPYLANRRFGGEELVLRFAELKNIHRVEASRWEVLLYIKRIWEARVQTLNDLKTSMGRRKKVVGFYNKRWTQLTFKDGTYSTDILEVNQDNVLDAMVEFGQHPGESELAVKYLRLADLLSKWNSTVIRISGVLQGMFRDLNPNKDFKARNMPIEVTINGRHYVSVHHHMSPGGLESGWPSPLNLILDLDEARYEPKVEAASS